MTTYRVKLEKRQSGTTHDGYCSDAETYEYTRDFTEVIEVSREFYNNYILDDGTVTGEGLNKLKVRFDGCDTGGSGYCGCETHIVCLSGKLVEK